MKKSAKRKLARVRHHNQQQRFNNTQGLNTGTFEYLVSTEMSNRSIRSGIPSPNELFQGGLRRDQMWLLGAMSTPNPKTWFGTECHG